MPDPVEVQWNREELAALARQDYLRRALASYGGMVAKSARAEAPRRTGAGAESIHGETVLEAGEWTARVSWDVPHFYMRFTDLGTKYIHGQHYLENALARYGRTAP